MPLDVENTLEDIELWFGKELSSETDLLGHLDLCTTMNTGNLRVHHWLMTTDPHLVAEYIEQNDRTPFQHLQLQCAVNYFSNTESIHSKLTVISRY